MEAEGPVTKRLPLSNKWSAGTYVPEFGTALGQCGESLEEQGNQK